MPSAIGTVQTAQRLGPAVGPVIGGVLAGLVGCGARFSSPRCSTPSRSCWCSWLYDERRDPRAAGDAVETRPRARSATCWRFENFLLLMVVIFGLQFVDRSFGPILPLYVEQLGVAHASRAAVPRACCSRSMAFTGALGHHFCGRLLRRFSAARRHRRRRRRVPPGMRPADARRRRRCLADVAASAVFGIAIGAAMTAAYTAAGAVIPPGAHGDGLRRPDERVAGRHRDQPDRRRAAGRRRRLRGVFVLDVVVLAVLAALVRRVMVDEGSGDGASLKMRETAALCESLPLTRLSIDPDRARRRRRSRRRRSAIRAGGIVALPTDTLYGLAADPFDADARRARVLRLKGRAAGARDAARSPPMPTRSPRTLGVLPTLAHAAGDRFWPGPLTLLVHGAARAGARRHRRHRPRRRARAGTCGGAGAVPRVPARPLTATSANMSGRPATDDPDAVAASLGDRIDLLLDAGPSRRGGAAVDHRRRAPTRRHALVRAGAIPWESIHDMPRSVARARTAASARHSSD